MAETLPHVTFAKADVLDPDPSVCSKYFRLVSNVEEGVASLEAVPVETTPFIEESDRIGVATQSGEVRFAASFTNFFCFYLFFFSLNLLF